MDPAHRPGDYLSAYARLFKIDEALRAGGRVNHATLAKNLGVSVRTIQRDFDYLRDSLRAPVEYDAKTKSWAYTERTFFLPSLLATADDLLALLLIRQAIEQYAGTPYAEAAHRAFALVEKALPEEGRLAAEWVKSRVAFTDFPPPEIPAEVWHAVLESLRTSRSLEISYAKPGEPAQSRKVDPYGLIVSEGDWYLYTHDRERNARRTFLLTRIERAKVTGDSYRIPADFDLNGLRPRRLRRPPGRRRARAHRPDHLHPGSLCRRRRAQVAPRPARELGRRGPPDPRARSPRPLPAPPPPRQLRGRDRERRMEPLE